MLLHFFSVTLKEAVIKSKLSLYHTQHIFFMLWLCRVTFDCVCRFQGSRFVSVESRIADTTG